MATSLLPTHSFAVRASSVSDNTRRKISSTTPAASAGGKWWSPLFGWSADADYIDSSASKEEANPVKSENIPVKSKFTRGCFTEEKAKQLRMMTKDTAAFHDAMYHSAIASRLASDFSDSNSSE
ncbi:hypothetical protein SOVF_006700 [Spinacia oleracea]|nr:hypothetical protein SOVF_006700 [Spinacia oleracea]